MKNLRKDKGGFTLVELMIVVVILGILVAIAVPIFSAVTSNAKKKTCRNNIDTIEKAGTQYLINRSDENIFGIFTANAGGGTTTTSATISSKTESESKLSAEFLSFFDGGELPLCEGETYTISINAANDNRSISVVCSEHGARVD